MSKDTPHGKEAGDEQSSLRGTVGDLALAWIVFVARLGAWVRRRRKVSSPDDGVIPGEVIVCFPDQEGRGAPAEQSMDAVRVAIARIGRRFKVDLSTTQALKVGRSHGIRRRYLRLLTEVGLEEDVVRAIRVAAWRSSLPRGRYGVIAIRSPEVRSASSMHPPGPIEFTPAYDAAKVAIGLDHVDASGVTILVADIEPPDTRFLPPDVAKQVEVLNAVEAGIQSGHATMVTAIVGDIAKGASIKALAFGDRNGAGSWSLLRVLLEEHEVDLVVASVSLPSGTGRNGLERDQVFDSLLRQRELLPHHPPMLFPTGNDDGTEPVSTIAVPARFEHALTIGAVNQGLKRPDGSRFGKKVGEDSSAWRMVAPSRTTTSGPATTRSAQWGPSSACYPVYAAFPRPGGCSSIGRSSA